MPDYSYLHGRFDHTFRVGRCPNRRCTVQLREGAVGIVDRPAYAWKASLGLRIDDGMYCPRCGSLLNKTSRDVHRLREFTDDELVKVFETTLAKLRAKLVRSQERYQEAEAAGSDAFILSVNYDYVERDSKQYARVDNGFRRWLSSGSDEHDAAVRSIGGQ